MKEHNKKEILTQQIINKEIKKICIYDLISVTPVLFPALVMAFGLYISSLMEKPPIILIVFMGALLIFFVFLYIFSSLDSLKILYKTTKDKLIIVNDVLIEKKEKIDFGPTQAGVFFNKPYCLKFMSKGEYFIVKRDYYKWSSKYPLNADGVYRYSNIDDEFYLVMCNKRIIMAYSTKLFELMD